MSQSPGGNPGPQPWATPPSDPQPAPGQVYPPGYVAQPGYGQPGYPPQPGYGAPNGQPGYPGAYPTQPGYPGQQAPASPPNYGYQQQPYAAAPYQPVPVANGPKNPMLGIIALAVVVLATIGSLAGGWLMIQEVQRFLADAVHAGTPSTDEIERAITGPIVGIGLAATIGFAGWVTGIVAAATNRGRVAGIVAIVVGVLAPVAIWVYIALSFASVAQPYR